MTGFVANTSQEASQYGYVFYPWRQLEAGVEVYAQAAGMTEGTHAFLVSWPQSSAEQEGQIAPVAGKQRPVKPSATAAMGGAARVE